MNDKILGIYMGLCFGGKLRIINNFYTYEEIKQDLKLKRFLQTEDIIKFIDKKAKLLNMQKTIYKQISLF